jgi:hypothetical protein
MRKEIPLAEYMPEIKRGTTPAEIVVGIRERLTRFCEAVHHDQAPDRNDAALAVLLIEGALGQPSAVAALRVLDMIDASGRIKLKVTGRKPGGLLDQPDAWHAIAYEAAAQFARGTARTRTEVYQEIAKRHRGLTPTRVRELYKGQYPLFQHHMQALPKRVTKEDVGREHPELRGHDLVQAFNRRVTEANQKRASIVSLLEKLANQHWSVCKKG